MISIALALGLATLPGPSPLADPPASKTPPSKVRKIALGGEGGWDYLTVDPAARRLYVSRGTRVVVMDIDKEAVVGEMADTPGVHGVAVVPDLNRGFTSNGGDDSVTAFDLKTLKATGKIKVGGRPDAIHYDPAANRVFTFNHGSKDATAIDPTSATVVGTVALEGVPEAAVSDGRGRVFVNLMDSSQVVEFDAKTFKVLNRWPLAPGATPTGLAIDREHRRLFSVCGNQKMVVLDADDGKVVGSVAIGRGSDGAGFDPSTGFAYSSNGGDGTVSVVGEASPGRYAAVATVPTQAGARTMALDPKSHRLYLSAATVAPTPAGQPPEKGRRRSYVPGSFVIVVVGE